MIDYDSFLTMVQNIIEDDSQETEAAILEWTNRSLHNISMIYDWPVLQTTTTLVSDESGLVTLPEGFQRVVCLFTEDWMYEFSMIDMGRLSEGGRPQGYCYIPHGQNNGQLVYQLYGPGLNLDPDLLHAGETLNLCYQQRPSAVTAGSTIVLDCEETLLMKVLQWAARNAKYDRNALELETEVQKALNVEIPNAGKARKTLAIPGSTGTTPTYAFRSRR